ncbi:hypothetical protein OG735_18970 [Streptomyces sp. NBC_01210]|uniref:hypothetical protein n=1 Tax=Streptomyces sp. NBC_01210 TaxID=2903774 RepID=UPI002E159553|nr:hypothetical protein OG735_18970 [Streptomyces sp. NBC_01210]
MRKLARIAAVAGAAAAIALGNVSSAQAASTWYAYAHTSGTAYGTFTDDGDEFRACDTKADGLGVWLKVTATWYAGPNDVPYTGSFERYFTPNAGNCSTYHHGNLVEDRTVKLTVCLGNTVNGSTSRFDCGSTITATS